jgi:nitrite reductase/ring-hydroxylating ferredoxin subunit/uncharacterized membrane protein
MMKRDLTERIERGINSIGFLNALAKWLRDLLDQIFLNGPLNPLKNFLNGRWLEHPLHSVLTDVPIGAWLIAVIFDLVALIFRVPNLGVASAMAIGVGVLGAIATIATGLMDWQDVNPRELTVGLTHGLTNILGTVLFTISFFWRMADNWQIDGGKALLSIIAYGVLTLGAYLGGMLVFRMGAMVNRNAFESGPKDFVSVLPMQNLEENKPIRVDAKGHPVLLVRRGEEVYSVGAVCSHYGGPLEQGKLVDGRIECPWHYSQFTLEEGKVVGGPATSPLPEYENRISNGQIQVRMKQTKKA